jgi:hypothetical protein
MDENQGYSIVLLGRFPGKDKPVGQALAEAFSRDAAWGFQVVVASPINLLTGITLDQAQAAYKALVEVERAGCRMQVQKGRDEQYPTVGWNSPVTIYGEALESMGKSATTLPSVGALTLACPYTGKPVTIKIALGRGPEGQTSAAVTLSKPPVAADAPPPQPIAAVAKPPSIAMPAPQPLAPKAPPQAQPQLEPLDGTPIPIPVPKPRDNKPSGSGVQRPAGSSDARQDRSTSGTGLQHAVQPSGSGIQRAQGSAHPGGSGLRARQQDEDTQFRARAASERKPSAKQRPESNVRQARPAASPALEILPLDPAPTRKSPPATPKPQADARPLPDVPVVGVDWAVPANIQPPSTGGVQAPMDLATFEKGFLKPEPTEPIQPPGADAEPHDPDALCSIFIGKTRNPQVFELLAEIQGISTQEAERLCSKAVVSVVKDIPLKDAEPIKRRFQDLKIKPRVSIRR